MDQPLLRLHNITKTYGDFIAVNQVSLDIPKGAIFGLLGPNGAGKTSMIRMITSITAPDSGEIFFDGQSLTAEHAAKIGYMPEERGLYKKMKVGEHLLYLLRLKGLSAADAKSKINHWLTKFEIAGWYDKEVGELSKGMQQKVQFISTVAHQPPLLILDEPFSGLDPINTELIENEIQRLNQEGTTIIFSTHRMEQVEEICEEIALINQGRIVLKDTVRNARHSFKKNEYIVEFEGERAILENIEGLNLLDETGDAVIVSLEEPHGINYLMKKLLETKLTLYRVEQSLPKLQEVFIKMVNQKGGEDG